MKLFVAILPLLAFGHADVCTPAVRKFCESDGLATACQNNQCPAAVKTSKNDPNFKKLMVDAHNKHRAEDFQGHTAADMLEVSWSDELAETALQWVLNLCSKNDALRPGHDRCRVVPSYDSVGQNLAWGAGSAWGGSVDAGVVGLVKMWNDEKKSATHDMMFPLNMYGPVIGHYTQVIWSTSFKIGCAYVTRRSDQYGYQGWLACNYAKFGNWRGVNPFTKGAPGSKCPAGSSKASNGLCRVHDENAIRRTIGLNRVG